MLYGDTQDITLNGQAHKGFKISLPNVNKTAVVRLPTSQEITTYVTAVSKLKKTATEDEKRTPDYELLKSITIAGDELDPYEAEVVVYRLTACQVLTCELEAGVYTTKLKTPFNEATHTLNAPSFKALSMFRSRLADSKSTYKPSADLYDSLVTKTEGYSTDVPLHHKASVANAVVADINSIDPLQIIDPNA